jgi:hypothetical protein
MSRTEYPELWITAGAVCAALAVLMAFALAGWPGAPNGCLERGACFCEAPRPGLVRQPANTFSNLGFVAVGLAVAAASGRLRARGGRPAAANPLTSGTLVSTLAALAIALLGPGSMFLHASLTGWGGRVDVLSMYLWASFAIAYAALRALRLSLLGFLGLFGALVSVTFWSKLASQASSDAIFGGLLAGFVLGEGAVWRRRELRQERRWLALAALCFGVGFALWLPSRRSSGPLCDPHSWLQGHAGWHLLCAAAAGGIWLYWWSEDADELRRFE